MPHNAAAVTAAGVATANITIFAQDVTSGDIAAAFPELTLAAAASGLAWYLLRRSDASTSERLDENRAMIQTLRDELKHEREARERERERLMQIIASAQKNTPPENK